MMMLIPLRASLRRISRSSWVVHQGAGEQDAARFPGRHLVGIAFRQVRNLEQFHHLPRLPLHFGRGVVIRPDPHAAEETGEHNFVPGVVARTHLHPVVGDDAEMVAQIEQMPAVAAQDT
jgi:hypothetical protein